MGGKVVKFRVLIGAAVLLGVIAAAEYAVKSYYYPKKQKRNRQEPADCLQENSRRVVCL